MGRRCGIEDEMWISSWQASYVSCQGEAGFLLGSGIPEGSQRVQGMIRTGTKKYAVLTTVHWGSHRSWPCVSCLCLQPRSSLGKEVTLVMIYAGFKNPRSIVLVPWTLQSLKHFLRCLIQSLPHPLPIRLALLLQGSTSRGKTSHWWMQSQIWF